MGNLVTLCATKDGSKLMKHEKEKIAETDHSKLSTLQVMNKDGNKMLEFKTSLLVKDLLANHPASYVGLFKEATQPLPPKYKLKPGKMYYYLLPNYNYSAGTRSKLANHNICEDQSRVLDDLERNFMSLVNIPCSDDHKGKKIKDEGKPKRIKILLTKDQLQRLISSQMGNPSMEDHSHMLSNADFRKKCHTIGSVSPIFVPKLKTVPERVESF